MNLSSHKLTMLTLNVLIFILAIAPSLISADLFPPDTGVEMLNKESFGKVKETVSGLCFYFEAGFDTISSEGTWLLHLLGLRVLYATAICQRFCCLTDPGRLARDG